MKNNGEKLLIIHPLDDSSKPFSVAVYTNMYVNHVHYMYQYVNEKLLVF